MGIQVVAGAEMGWWGRRGGRRWVAEEEEKVVVVGMMGVWNLVGIRAGGGSDGWESMWGCPEMSRGGGGRRSPGGERWWWAWRIFHEEHE